MKRGTGEEEEGAVEAAGILGNLNIPDLDFGKIVHDMQLLPFLTGKLKVHLPITSVVVEHLSREQCHELDSHLEYFLGVVLLCDMHLQVLSLHPLIHTEAIGSLMLLMCTGFQSQ